MTAKEKKSPSSRRRRAIAVALILALLFLGILIWIRRPGLEEGPPPEPPAAPVEVVTVAEMTMEDVVRGIGTLQASESVQIVPETAGRVRTIHFQEGGIVEEGQLLVELDDEKLQRELAARRAALRAAEVRASNAERTFQRQQPLAEEGIIAADDMDQIQSELESARADVDRFEAEVALTEEQLSDTRIRAPFGGSVSERQVDRGAFVGLGDVLVSLYQTDPLEITFNVPERYMGRIRHGQQVRVSVAAHPRTRFDGTVDFISPAIDEATRTLQLKAVVANPDRKLSPGASATAMVTVDRLVDQPVVPEESLVATRTGYSVFVVENEVVRFREVQTGLRREGMVQIVEGLEPGEAVVRAGHLRIDDGQRVRVVNDSDEARPSG